MVLDRFMHSKQFSCNNFPSNFIFFKVNQIESNSRVLSYFWRHNNFRVEKHDAELKISGI